MYCHDMLRKIADMLLDVGALLTIVYVSISLYDLGFIKQRTHMLCFYCFIFDFISNTLTNNDFCTVHTKKNFATIIISA